MRNARDKSTPTIAQPDAGAEPGDLKAPAVASAAAQDRALSTRQLAWRRFKRHKLAMISAFVLGIIALAAILAPLIAKYNYHAIFTGPVTDPVSLKHWFGTDELGRDEFSRVLYAGRVSRLGGFSVAVPAGVSGSVSGSIAGF